MEIKKEPNWGVKTGDPTGNSQPIDFKLPDNKEDLEIIPLELALIDEKIPEILKKYGLEASDADISSIKKEIDVNSESIVDGIYEGIEENLGEDKNKLDLFDFKKEPIRGVVDHLVDKVILYAMTAIIGMIHEDERTPVQIANLNKIEKIVAGWEKGEEGGEAPSEGELNLEKDIKMNVSVALDKLTHKVRAYTDLLARGEVLQKRFSSTIDPADILKKLEILENDENRAFYERTITDIISRGNDKSPEGVAAAAVDFIDLHFRRQEIIGDIMLWMDHDRFDVEPKPPTEPKEEKKPKNKFETALSESIKRMKRIMNQALEYAAELGDPQKEALITDESIRGKFDRIIMKRLQEKLTEDQDKEIERLSDFSEYNINELRTRIGRDEGYILLNRRLKEEKAKEKKNLGTIRSLTIELGEKLRSIFDHEVREKFRSNALVGNYVRALLALELHIRRKHIKIVEKDAGSDIPTGEDLSTSEEIEITPDQWEYVEYTKELIAEYLLKAPKIASEKEGRDVNLGELKEQLTSFVGELWKSLGEQKYERAFRPGDLERIVDYIIQGERKYGWNFEGK